MTNKTETFLFGWAVVLGIIVFATIPMLIGGCLANSAPIHYYKIQRLNINGEVQQVYYSKGYPWGTDGYVSFTEYPSNRDIKMHTPYIAEDIGTNKPSL
jgi:hypothetical protein